MNGLFKVALKTPFDESGKGLSFTGQLVPATPEEIKQAHGKCGDPCIHFMQNAYDSDLTPHDFFCTYHQMPIDEPLTDYCNHHEPKEREDDGR